MSKAVGNRYELVPGAIPGSLDLRNYSPNSHSYDARAWANHFLVVEQIPDLSEEQANRVGQLMSAVSLGADTLMKHIRYNEVYSILPTRPSEAFHGTVGVAFPSNIIVVNINHLLSLKDQGPDSEYLINTNGTIFRLTADESLTLFGARMGHLIAWRTLYPQLQFALDEGLTGPEYFAQERAHHSLQWDIFVAQTLGFRPDVVSALESLLAQADIVRQSQGT